MKTRDNFNKRKESKKEKQNASWILKIPFFKKIHKYFREEDCYVLKWCGMIFLILIFGAGFFQVKVYREKMININIGLNQERFNAQNSNLQGYRDIPQYSVSVNNKHNLVKIMVVAVSESEDTMICCQLDADKSQYFQTQGITGNRDNLFVYLQNRDTLQPTTLRDSTSFLMGIDKRRIVNGSSTVLSGVIELYYLRFTDTMHFGHDYLIMTYTLLNGSGQSLYTDQAVLSYDNLQKEARNRGEVFSLESTLCGMSYLDGLLTWANRFDSIYPALQMTTPVNHPLTLRNLIVNTDNGYVIEPQARSNLEINIADFAEKAKIFADNQEKKNR